MKREFNILLQGTQQLNRGAIVSGVGFLLYLGASALAWTPAADILGIAFTLVSVYVFLSAAAGRRKNKEAVSYSLLWGQAALTALMCMCAFLTVWDQLAG